jgi:hypothetical protein
MPVVSVALLWLTSLAVAATPSPDLQSRVRATTYEVVVRKSEPTVVVYERPLPLELIPFAVRNDAYWSIGTAVAIAPGVFASAAHVIAANIGSPFGTPALRDASGKVYPLDRVLKFSLQEDFIEFSVVDPPEVTLLETRRDYILDSPVYAVGNALGEGIIVRDGLLTSVTPEERDGRWNWLRFSAAASPGNSGGPLLDEEGRIIGLVIGKSPNENLNYALPISRVLDDPGSEARFDVRGTFVMPILRDPMVSDFRTTFRLPAAYATFAESYLAAGAAYYTDQRRKLLAEQADVLFPRGDSAKLLSAVYEADIPGLISQQDDGVWHVDFGSERQDTRLAGGARIRTASVDGTTLFRMQSAAPATASGDPADSRVFMDDLLKALRLPRIVGTQAIRITSLGAHARGDLFTDAWGRVWQLRIWPLGYVDLSVLVASLPTPDGALGMVRLAPGQQLGQTSEELKFLADYFYMSYSGTLPQWRGFLARRDVRPSLFDSLSWQTDDTSGFHYQSPGLAVPVSTKAISLTDAAILDLRTTFVLLRDKLSWQIGGLRLSQDASRKTFLAVNRQLPPPESSDPEKIANWNAMQQRSGKYSGTPQHDNEFSEYWMRTTVGDSTAGLYEVLYRTDRQLLPRQMDEISDDLLRGIRVTEP